MFFFNQCQRCARKIGLLVISRMCGICVQELNAKEWDKKNNI